MIECLELKTIVLSGFKYSNYNSDSYFMKKKIVFLDAIGTLWYPKLTQNYADPGWVFKNKWTKNNPIRYMTLTPGVKPALIRLKKLGIKLVIISAITHESHKVGLKKLMKRFKIYDLIDEYHTVGYIDGSAKAKKIEHVLKRLGLKKSQALMVGDFYWRDYKHVKERGIDAILFHSEFQNARWPQTARVKKRIRNLKNVLKYIN